MKLKTALFAFVICVLGACSKNQIKETTTGTNSPGALAAPGYGSSGLPFAAKSWTLPPGVQLADSIHDYAYCWAFAPYTQVLPKDWKGVPLGFTFCFALKNTSAQPVIIQFPPQLIFSSGSSLHQHVLTIDIGTVTLPAGTARTIVAQGFCINKGRKPPQTFSEETGDFLSYSFGPSAIPAALQEIVDMVKSQNISMADIIKADGTIDNAKAVKFAVIQKAIWEVTDGQGITPGTKNELLHVKQ